ncbi:RT0821/Lpp0805 family surface protein [Terrihabitans sp. PJ23]|uniref:RT0821/Lpp0805 family surface protein n=2 Tax=Terrihabitans rhizophilus TaxID=3092662 RepID=A0ABU4RMH8_9HYPH|nr:RT0821/Lpp0805 family surface protein [Terrihabitans sp. PJ23]
MCGALGACSMPMGALTSDARGGKKPPETTGSVGLGRSAAVSQAALPPPAGATGSSGPISQADWGYARGALGLALTSTQTGAPVPWANPDTGTHGNFAPAAPAVTASGQTCRDFVATRMENGQEVRLGGRACLNANGQWDIAPTTRTTS